jgi:hypothetical protein
MQILVRNNHKHKRMMILFPSILSTPLTSVIRPIKNSSNIKSKLIKTMSKVKS